MEFIVFISYILFAFLLFLFLNFLMKKFSLNKIEYILFSNIFLVVVASFASYFHLATFCDNIFIIIVFEFLIRMLYTTYILEKDFFSKEEHQLILYLENIIVAYLLNQFIIRQVDMVFLNPEQLKFLLWVFIFIFLYHFLYQGRTSNFKMLVHKQQEIGDKKQYIITQYAKMKQKYGNEKDILFVPDYASQHKLIEENEYITFMPYSAYIEVIKDFKYNLRKLEIEDFSCEANIWWVYNTRAISDNEKLMIEELQRAVKESVEGNV